MCVRAFAPTYSYLLVVSRPPLVYTSPSGPDLGFKVIVATKGHVKPYLIDTCGRRNRTDSITQDRIMGFVSEQISHCSRSLWL